MTSSALPKLCLGGNVFGWTADEEESFAVLDAAADAGIHFIDTADVYSAWVNDGAGGQSETILGRWIASRAARSTTLIATKGGKLPALGGIRPATLTKALDGSLERLGTEHVDLYYAHADDGGDLTESLAAFDGFIEAGKIGNYGLSNFTAERLREVYAIVEREGFAKPAALQPEYSLVAREFEDELQGVAAEHELPVLPYFSLASGFLTGKYRPGQPLAESQRSGRAGELLEDDSAVAVLEALLEVAEAHDAEPASVAIAWLNAQETVAAPIASARTVEQISPLAHALTLELAGDEVERLTAAGRSRA